MREQLASGTVLGRESLLPLDMISLEAAGRIQGWSQKANVYQALGPLRKCILSVPLGDLWDSSSPEED